VSGCLVDDECAIHNNSCYQGCPDNTHYFRIDGECVLNPNCVSHNLKDEDVWNCNENHCSAGYDDFDRDGVCPPADCYGRTYNKTDKCGVGCMVDVDGLCKQSCEDKHLYMIHLGKCILKPKCSKRHPSLTALMPCGERCIYNSETNVCSEGRSGRDGCGARVPVDINNNDPCGKNCVLDSTGWCYETCTYRNLYYIKDGKCMLIEKCDERKPNYDFNWPCGPACYMDPVGGVCMGDKSSGGHESCPAWYDDADKDGICEPADCMLRTPIGSEGCSAGCALVAPDTCEQGC
jgi:hypothetical protein